MRLLQCDRAGGYHLTESLPNGNAVPRYAILSHTWGADSDEVTFDDLTNGTGTDKAGNEKIRFCAEQAKQDGLEHFWIDTCCIDKKNKAELSHAINSMFQWYRNAARCYAYLSDVSTAEWKADSDTCEWEFAFRGSKWFTRGWTLQELLAPRSIEFFSWQRKWLGNRNSLKQQIHEITGIPEAALRGELLSQFSVNDRLSWIQHRETKYEEDKAYSLLGIFGVYMPPIYGEGVGRAFDRLRDEIKKLKDCTRDLHVTDPRRDKARIEETKGGLLEDSYDWILKAPDFRRWQEELQSRLLWIKGDPGKGKTMLLCGIINELSKLTAKTYLLVYFFCQATDSRINSATAVLRGLLFMLVSQQPSLISHLREKYDQTGKALFEDANAWIALSDIFASVVQDPSLNITYLVVDALDECVTDLSKLLDLIVQTSSASSRVKWIISSRNWPNIEEHLERAEDKIRLSLELNADSVSAAVRSYIKHKVSRLAQDKKYSDQTEQAVSEYLYNNANDTFLWVALVCKNLEEMSRFNIIKKLEVFPPGLNSLYDRMVQRINTSDDAELCKRILATVAIVYRPVTLQELTSLVEDLDGLAEDPDSVREIIDSCGSFLTIRDGTIYFVHQSAKDFLLKEALDTTFPSGREVVHYTVFSRSLLVMSNVLRRDIYRLGALGCLIEQIEQPRPDPLVASRYSCIYWIDHLCDWSSDSLLYGAGVLASGGIVDVFIRKNYLYWLEAMSLCKSISNGVISMAKLEALTENQVATSSTMEVVQDARRFIMYHKSAIEGSPLQAYGVLLFSPSYSIIRVLFESEEPKWMVIKPEMQDRWGNCLQTLEGHNDYVTSVAFSHDSTKVASASSDSTVRVWDSHSSECLLILKGHSGGVNSVTFSHDSTRLASGSDDCTIKIWDTSNGECIQIFEGHSDSVNSVAFSHDSAWLASGSYDCTVKIWDTSNGECIQTFEGHSGYVTSVAFSHDSAWLVSGSYDRTVKNWDTSNGECIQTFEGHSGSVTSVAFSHDSAWLASGSHDCTVKIWDTSNGECIQTFEGHSGSVNSVAFSHDSTWLVSGSYDCAVKIWDTSNGECIQTLEGHSSWVKSVAFSHDSTWLASGSIDCTVKIWDTISSASLQTFESHNNSFSSVAFSYDSGKDKDTSSAACTETPRDHSERVNSVVFSHDSARLASGSDDCTVKIWDTSNGECIQTFEGHSGSVNTVAFSHDSAWLASGSDDGTVKIWETRNGECIQTFEGHSGKVFSVTFSPDSTWLASECSWLSRESRTLCYQTKLWDVSSGRCLQNFEGIDVNGFGLYIGAVAFSHDSAWLALATYDKTVEIRDASSGACLQTFNGHDGEVSSVAFSHDLAWLASASFDHTVKIWDASSGICLQTFIVGRLLDHIAFDVTDSYLHTSIGSINIGAQPDLPSLRTISEPCVARYQGPALSADGVWIKYNSQCQIWLPSEYRPSCSAVSGSTIAVGIGNGRVLMYMIEEPDMP